MRCSKTLFNDQDHAGEGSTHLLPSVLAAAVSRAGAGEVPEDFKLMTLSHVSLNSIGAASLEDSLHQQNLSFLLLGWAFHVFKNRQ